MNGRSCSSTLPTALKASKATALKGIKFWGFGENMVMDQVANRVRLEGPLEPDELWLPEDMVWNGSGIDRRFPIFSRDILRSHPPVDPAGLQHASLPARMRWQEDQFRFPPYLHV